MPEATHSVVIERAVPDVFTFFTTPANDPTWRPAVKEISAHGPLAVGEHVHQVVRGPGGRGIAADTEVTEFEPERLYAFRVVAGPVRPMGRMTFAPSGTGTEVTFTLSAEVGGLKRLLMGKAVQKSMDSEVAALDTARSLLESNA